MTGNSVALVVGATGLSGSYVARHLKDNGWTVVTTSTRPADLRFSDRHIAVNLQDGDATAARLREAGDVTHVFYCTWARQPDESGNVRVNSGMMGNLFAGLSHAPIRHAALVTGLKHYLGSFDNYAVSKPYTPFLENQPRLPGENFYYALEDVLFAEADRRDFTWSVHRPHSMIGFVVGNAMNMAVTLAVYATICKATGRPFVFPGSRTQHECITDVSDAGIVAEQMAWAATTPQAANTPFNLVNGDVFRWYWLWQQIADYFGIEAADYPGHPTPLQEQMADAGEIWPKIVARHALADIPVTRLASWWHSDADLGREIECLTDMTNSRTAGFTGYRSTPRSFFAVFDELKARNIIPS